ncbi:MAG TPA: FAD-dependent oxidoreductase [Leptospiraceae bacterium]|nr:FAD-dependent oxidoreductase [Spirochaetaceae bacterium]HBS04969.1 FAD-dependent oxidoreductase [Leptospiraceae bacterium]|tara:strand:+ start:21658 stop:23031 length:1374 start_codon:yes stop_codon:yes gene_type:complete
MKEPVLVIIGNGITGITVARTVRKQFKDVRIRIVSDEADYFFSRPALMYIYMGHMEAKQTEPYERRFYDENRLELVRGTVDSINPDSGNLTLKGGQQVPFDYLVLATGSVPNRFGWPGQDLDGVQGLYSMQDLQNLEHWSQKGIKKAVIVGGGLIGIELAEMLHTRNIPATFLVREDHYWGNILPPEESELVRKEIDAHHIGLKLKTELKSIESDENGRARAVHTSDGERIEADFVGLTAGVRPNLSVSHDSVETQRGYLVDYYFQTSHRKIFAAGDCAQFRASEGPGPVEQLWYTGRMQGEALGINLGHRLKEEHGLKLRDDIPVREQVLPEHRAYDRGIWFNSAKFFNLEYQTYGFVPARLDTAQTFYWQHPDKSICFRMVWDGNLEDGKVSGFNVFGVRYRQEVCEKWIADGRSPRYVIDHLKEANFDPEFFERPEKKIRKAFKEFARGAGAIA